MSWAEAKPLVDELRSELAFLRNRAAEAHAARCSRDLEMYAELHSRLAECISALMDSVR